MTSESARGAESAGAGPDQDDITARFKGKSGAAPDLAGQLAREPGSP
jgi:hypothetical protein